MDIKTNNNGERIKIDRKIRIDVDLSQTYYSKTMDIYDEDQFLYDSYVQAKNAVSSIVKETHRYHMNSNLYNGNDVHNNNLCKQNDFNLWGLSQDNINQSYYSSLKLYGNNIIAICAERGYGKTSTMISFSQALRNYTRFGSGVEYNKYKDFFVSDNNDIFLNKKFKVLSPIDPTSMEKNESILKIILSRMFHCVQKNLSENNYHNISNQYEKNSFIEKFEKCYNSISVLKDEKNNQYADLIEQLSELGDSSDLKIQFHEAVCELLNYFFKGDIKDKYLVIQIDDADMNVRNAYEIIEEIRKYCIIPNVIVIIATNLTQLSRIIEQHFLLEFNKMTEFEPEYYRRYCHEITQKYLDKLFPALHQIHLPNVDYVLQNSSYSLDLNIYDSLNNNWFDFIDKDYQNVLIELMLIKTGIVLIKSKNHIHDFLPKSLRELVHFLEFLNELEDIPKGGGVNTIRTLLYDNDNQDKKKIISIWQRNLEKFMSYLLNEWAAINLTSNQKDFLYYLSNQSTENKKRYFYNHYLTFIKKKDIEKFDAFKEINLTFMSINEILELMWENTKSTNESSFIYSIHLYFSIYSTMLFLRDIIKDTKTLVEYLDGDNFIYNKISKALAENNLNYPACKDFKKLYNFKLHKLTIKKFNKSINSNIFVYLVRKNKKISSREYNIIESKSFDKIIFDPLNIVNIIYDNEVSVYSSSLETIKLLTLQLSLNWDLQKKLLKELLLYIESDYEKEMNNPNKMLETLFNILLKISPNEFSSEEINAIHFAYKNFSEAYLLNNEFNKYYSEEIKKFLSKKVHGEISQKYLSCVNEHLIKENFISLKQTILTKRETFKDDFGDFQTELLQDDCQETYKQFDLLEMNIIALYEFIMHFDDLSILSHGKDKEGIETNKQIARYNLLKDKVEESLNYFKQGSK